MLIEQLIDAQTILGEGPLWDIEEQRLYWIDSLGCSLHRSDARGRGQETWALPSEIGSMTLRREGGAVLALRTGLHTFEFASGRCELIADPEVHQPLTRLNDGKVDRQGRFVFGSMDMGEAAPIGSLYRLNADLSIETLATGFAISNGPCFSPDGATLYFSDSAARKIFRFRYSDSGVTDQRVYRDLTALKGMPDGATVDEEGCIWFVEVFGGKIHRMTPQGELLRTIEMPVLKVTSLCFGGADLDALYVTSMAKPPLPKYPKDGPLGGSIFAIRGLGARGLAERRFVG